MPDDVVTAIVIDSPREAVAAFAGDPADAPRWYANIKSVAWETAPPLAAGSRVAFVARIALRNRGAPSGFSALVAPVMEAAMRRANRQDLARLKAVLEAT